MTGALCDAFVAELKSGRDDFNVRFEQARHLYPGLHGTDFSAFLFRAVDPLVRAVARVKPDRIADTVHAAYELGLELVGQRLAGPRAALPWIDQSWQRLLCALAPVVCEDPLRITGAICNAVHNLSTTPGARPAVWIEGLEKMAPHVGDADTLLALGQLLAWRCGLAHYREGALAAGDRLPPRLALAAVGAVKKDTWPQVRARLDADPWHIPGNATRPGPGPVAKAGGFRGFDGLFTDPPFVVAAHDQFLVLGGNECWLLSADAFGATFHRASPDDFAAAPAVSIALPGDVRLPASAGKVTSVARTRCSLAVTASLTHCVLLYARPGDT